MKKSLITLISAVLLISCNKQDKFHVSGAVKGAKNQTLYFEHNGLLKTNTLDSVKLDKDGNFSFKSNRPAYPDLYNLRLGNKLIIFAVDSCEELVLDANNENFAIDYTVKGSATSLEIQKLRKSVMKIQRELNETNPEMSAETRNKRYAEIQREIEAHKDSARSLILRNPRSLAAYFALYQKVNDIYLFSPYSKTDRPFYSAVATSFNAYMPEYERTKNIYNLVIDAIHSERDVKEKELMHKLMEESGKGYIDIALKDKNNKEHKLSNLEGKVVLLDFSAYESDQSVEYTFALRDLYNKFHKRGLEIYQVSLDRNKLSWEKSVENIPWICVRDEEGPNAVCTATYNITSLPTNFLINKKGNIVARSLPFNELSKQIEKSL
ncbi:MAG TPA: thioredoxin-like domain-containing protein [Paludibacter sp.]|nr:thioredoxin-like domain-containing protein [Paludibacter sp.]